MPRERDGQSVVVVETSGASLGPFLTGLVLGAAAALLWAPRSGAETRRLIGTRGREFLDAASDKADALRGAVEEGYERGKARVEEGIEDVRRSIDDRRTATHDAVEAGRAAVHSARDELERRLGEARAARKSARRSGDEAPAEE